jgi:hypothetical protein
MVNLFIILIVIGLHLVHADVNIKMYSEMGCSGSEVKSYTLKDTSTAAGRVVFVKDDVKYWNQGSWAPLVIDGHTINQIMIINAGKDRLDFGNKNRLIDTVNIIYRYSFRVSGRRYFDSLGPVKNGCMPLRQAHLTRYKASSIHISFIDKT